ncbi:MAG: PEP-CTERM sorting domain-containing protein [Phycisphaeraceae bacterium]|nr:PEP-CTERM sorting domain-containing protein [Phycisphaeraceae bacterium]
MMRHVVVCVVCGSAASGACAQAWFTGIGDLPGGNYLSGAAAVSGNGHVTVGGSTGPVGFVEPVRWTHAGGLSSLPVSGMWGELSTAEGVNIDGSVVVGQSSGEAFRWTDSGGMMGLGFLPGKTNSWAWGVSHDGNTVVGYSGLSLGAGREAFRWTPSTGMVALGDLPGGENASEALGSNADGTVIVGAGHSSLGSEAFRWTPSTGMTGLGDLPGGEFGSAARAVSADGLVVVGAGNSAAGKEATIWKNGSVIGLGDLPGGEYSSIAFATNFDGSVVVGSANLSQDAFYWTESLGMVKLHDHLVSLGVTGLDGWTLTAANGISDDGLTIAGMGINPLGQNEGWVAHIPAPSSCVVLAIGGVIASRRRR